MLGKRILVIDKLIISPPDDLMGEYERGDLTIDDILQWFLDYRKKASTVVNNNRVGNYTYFTCDCPYGCNPENPTEFTSENLMRYLSDTDSTKHFAGIITSLVYDDELQSYRNCYCGDEEIEFIERKQLYLDERRKSLSTDDDSENIDCNHCDHICDEDCPEETY